VVLPGLVAHSYVAGSGRVLIVQHAVGLADLEILGPRFSMQMAYPFSRVGMIQSKNLLTLWRTRPIPCASYQ
jgi:hypothetical protein